MMSLTSRPRLAALAAACLLTVALPSAAMAQKTKDKGVETTAEQPPAFPTEFSVEIPTIDAVDANLDETVLRDIFSGNLAEHADELAGLTATSITIPQIDVIGTGEDGEEVITYTLTDLVLTDVVDGIAASASLGETSFISGLDDTSGQLGATSASTFNIAGMLGFYGLVDASDQTELETIYTDFSFTGGEVVGDEFSCSIGDMSVAEFKARPLKTSFGEMMEIFAAMEAQEESTAPETIGRAMRMYADLFTAFESTPFTFNGFECSGTDSDGRDVVFGLDSIAMGGMTPGYYPAYSMNGLTVDIGPEGNFNFDSVEVKGMDLTGPLAVVEAAPDQIDEAWLLANFRGLMPAFEGFSIDGFSTSLIDPYGADGEFIDISIGSFDLTLGSYLNGIPTAISTELANLIVNLPAESEDEQLQQLIDLGVTDFDVGFVFDAAWSEAEDTIVINEASATGANLATAVVTGTIINASESLFGLDVDAALAAAMSLAISDLKLDVTDTGLTELVLASVAAEQGSDPETLRTVFAGIAEGTIVSMLADMADAQKVGSAISSFVSGAAKQLTIDVTAKDSAGVSLLDFAAAETDPTVILDQVNVTATAQ